MKRAARMIKQRPKIIINTTMAALYLVAVLLATFVFYSSKVVAAPLCTADNLAGTHTATCPPLPEIDQSSNNCYVVNSSSVNQEDCARRPASSHSFGLNAEQSYSSSNKDEDKQTYNFAADCKPDGGGELSAENCGIVAYLVVFIQILSAAVGVLVVIMIVWGGIKYTSSKDNPQQTAEAKETIRNAIIGLVAYFFIFAFLQWLIPGGIIQV